MPGNTTAVHPSGLKIYFTEDDHKYIDELGREYTSVTTLIHNAFPAFDAEKIAAAKSTKTGIPAGQYIAEWEANRDKAANDGTRVHENCEYQFLSHYDRMHRPANELERARFEAAWNKVEYFKSLMHGIEPEKLVFSPRYRIAGSIDIFTHHGPAGVYLGDWKLVKELKRTGFNRECGITFATRQLEHCNFNHYSLQLSIYELLLRIEGYVNPFARFDRDLWVYDHALSAFECVCVPYLLSEAALLLAEHTSRGMDDVPF